jgi:hypothetical protein
MMSWKVCIRKRSWTSLNYHSGICLEGLSKTTENLSQDSWSPSRDLNFESPKYEAEVLTTQQQHSVNDNVQRSVRGFWRSKGREHGKPRQYS